MAQYYDNVFIPAIILADEKKNAILVIQKETKIG